ncbi:MAG: hypothetical protein WC822_05305 [Candidatus Paceibacterota bacterium]|jgi:hypothetical protein
MTDFSLRTEDNLGRQIKPVMTNTTKDGSGTFLFPLIDSDGHLQVDALSSASIVPGTGATNLGKAEDAAHTSADTGVMLLGVRKDSGTTLVSADGDYAPIQVDQHGGIRVGRPVFGEPTLHYANNSAANWCQGMVSPLDQKSPTGWLADLYGGVQTGDDWARVSVPMDELPLTKLTPATLATQWNYYMTTNDYMGVSMVIWVHDPANFKNRAELTQDALDVESAAAWNKHVLADANHFFYYGEITGTPDTTPTAGTHYTLAQFKADSIFSTYTIYRITFEFGWGAAGNTFGDAYVSDIQINGIVIPLKPDSSGTGRIAQRLISVDTGALASTIAPKTPYRLLSMDVHASAVLDTGEVLTLTKDAGAGSFFDTVILSDDLFVGSRTSEHYAFGTGYEFPAEDEIDIAQANGSNDDLGITVMYQTVF